MARGAAVTGAGHRGLVASVPSPCEAGKTCLHGVALIARAVIPAQAGTQRLVCIEAASLGTRLRGVTAVLNASTFPSPRYRREKEKRRCFNRKLSVRARNFPALMHAYGGLRPMTASVMVGP